MERKAAINEQTKDEEARKIRLENKFRPTVTSLFNRMAKAFENLYLTTGQIIQYNEFSGQWAGALETHYRRVGKDFTSNVRKSGYVRDLMIKQDEDELTGDEIAAVAAAYLLFTQSRVSEQTTFIISTSNDDVLQAVQGALRQFRIDNPLREPTNEEIGRRASKILRKKFNSRITTITNMQTQAPAEEAKRLEARALAGVALLPFQLVTDVPDQVTKLWADVRDSAVRDAHAAANGQRRIADDPFIVGGERLQYPGDGSLGASIGNLANCRCSAIYKRA